MNSRESSPKPWLPLTRVAPVLAMIPVTLAWDLIGSTESQDTLLAMLLPGLDRPGEPSSAGLLWLIMTTILVIVVTLACESSPQGKSSFSGRWRLKAFAAAIPILATVLYSVLLAVSLARPVEPLALLNGYLVTLALGLLGQAWALAKDAAPSPVRLSRRMASAALAMFLGVVVLAWFANIVHIRADMVYKQGMQYDGAQNWSQAAAKNELDR